jgi:thymidylate synthase (FAD)
MMIRNISITENSEQIILYCARVSNPKNQDSGNTKLIRYCIEHGHWSIFEMAHATYEITTSRAIAAQILRHRSFSFQEFSQRYAKAQTYVPVEARRQDKTNRQNSIDDLPEDVKAWFSLCQEYIWEESHYLYEKALELGIAKEQARNVLPLSTETKLYMSGSIRSWIHYFQVRCSVETQKEHRDIALQIRSDLAMRVPHIAQALQWKSADDEFLENLLTTAPKHDTIFAC